MNCWIRCYQTFRYISDPLTTLIQGGMHLLQLRHQTFNYNSNPLTAMRRAGIQVERELRLQLTTADGLPSRPLPFCVAACRQWDQINQSFFLTYICGSSTLFSDHEVSAIPCKIYGLSNVN